MLCGKICFSLAVGYVLRCLFCFIGRFVRVVYINAVCFGCLGVDCGGGRYVMCLFAVNCAVGLDFGLVFAIYLLVVCGCDGCCGAFVRCVLRCIVALNSVVDSA